MNQRHATTDEWNSIINRARAKGHGVIADQIASGHLSYRDGQTLIIAPTDWQFGSRKMMIQTFDGLRTADDFDLGKSAAVPTAPQAKTIEDAPPQQPAKTLGEAMLDSLGELALAMATGAIDAPPQQPAKTLGEAMLENLDSE